MQHTELPPSNLAAFDAPLLALLFVSYNSFRYSQAHAVLLSSSTD